MGLVDYAEESASHPIDYSSMIQMFNRFLLEQFALEISPFRSPIIRDPVTMHDQDPITQLVGVRARTMTECTNCGAQSEKPEGTRLIDLVYSKVFYFSKL
jgi:PAB-dependent poly(A)-specific ribonuclease subunit 2